MTDTRPPATRPEARPATARPSGGPAARPAARAAAPGLAVVALATVLVLAGSRLLPTVSPLVTALTVGALVGSTVLGRARRPAAARRVAALRPGIGWTSSVVLRVGVVLLGLQLSVPEVLALGWRGLVVVTTTLAVTFAGTLALGRLLRVPRATALLVATGFSICGAAAVSAMQGVVARPGRTPAQVREDDDAVATALTLVTVYGTLAIVVLPWLAGLLRLDDAQTGLWIGASVQEVAQVVTAAGTVSAAALATATVAKLARVALLAPVVTGAGIVAARGGDAGTGRVVPVPWFVVGFLVAVAVRSAGVVPAPVLEVAQVLTTVAFVAAMFALGLGVDVPRLVRTGRRPLVLGALSALVVTTTSLAGVLLLG
ncbi:YeiH family protein [Cellulosimicrobium marinum]|uniref:YeiH family protein n=1 Tax=Cellulosimicrobium marinum TaxID=1638992 RepID=UPI001E564504|nr:putative sulfate exporter family transporter [Cellulosimicrobium marinum]MCB7137906.1 putative sulfate exporter family transporter [Cellulosimicrobium marinum]